MLKDFWVTYILISMTCQKPMLFYTLPVEIRKNLRGGRTMDHRGHVRCISCDGRTALLLYRWHTLDEAGWHTLEGQARVDVRMHLSASRFRGGGRHVFRGRRVENTLENAHPPFVMRGLAHSCRGMVLQRAARGVLACSLLDDDEPVRTTRGPTPLRRSIGATFLDTVCRHSWTFSLSEAVPKLRSFFCYLISDLFFPKKIYHRAW